MKQRLFIFLLAGVFLFSSSGCTHSNLQKTLEMIPIDVSLINEDLNLQELKDLNRGNVKITYPPDREIPNEIEGVFSTRKIFTAKDAVYAMLSVRSLMQIEDTSFACVKTKKRGENIMFGLQQVYKGIEVASGFLRVEASKDGTPVLLSGYYMQGVDLDVEPKISNDEAKKAVNMENGMKITESRLVVYGKAADFYTFYGKPAPEYRLAWFFFLSSSGSEKSVYIDAITGEVLQVYASRLIDRLE